MEWKDEELYIITLNWKGTFKRLYLGGEKGPAGEERFEKVLRKIDQIGDSAKNWGDFFNNSVDAFKKYGFERVDK